MLRKTFSGLILIVLLTGILTSTINIQPVKASGTIYIRADGSVDPPDSPIVISDNVTYTLTGNISSSGDGIVVERSNIIVDGVCYTLQGAEAYPSKGIDLTGRSNVTIKNTNIKNFYCGVCLSFSSNNTVSRNTITNNGDGVSLHDSSNNNTISGNNITANFWHGTYLFYSSNSNSITGNNITNNCYSIRLSSSSNNTISGNNITNNRYGIWLYSSSNNRFYHNNFINNTYQVYLIGSFNNTWDNGCEGNYWSNYNGTDLDGDGIGDTELPWEAVDNYPLMNPYWLPGDVNHDLKIDIYDVVRITAIYGSEQGDPNWNCHSDIAEPYGIINIYDVVACTKDYGKEYTP